MKNKYFKRILAIVFSLLLAFNCIPMSVMAAAGNTTDETQFIDAVADPSTSDLRAQFKGVTGDDGKILTDKTVHYGSDEKGAFASYNEDEFSVELSALGQSYSITETEETVTTEQSHADVVFVIDASGSMRAYNVANGTTTRAEATIFSLNNAIKTLYENDPETRIGIVTFSNDFIEEGIYLPLDKYTLPEGQTDYITWGGRMVATTQSPDITAFVTPLCSGSITRTTYFYPTRGTANTTNTRYYLRYAITTNGGVTRYNANSYTGSSLGTVADGKYINDTNNGNTIYRKGSTYYVYKTTEFNAGLEKANSTSAFGEQNLKVRTVSNATTVTPARAAEWPGYDSNTITNSNHGWYRPSNNAMTKLGTAQNGVTYYAVSVYWNNAINHIALYTDRYEWPIGRVVYNASGVSTSTYSDDYITVTASSSTQIKYTFNTYEDKNNANIYFEQVPYLAATNFLVNSNGDIIPPSSLQFVESRATYTQAGLQAAENMFASVSNKENRIPALVLISDGIPTIANTNTQNPDLKFTNINTPGTTVLGTGMTNNNANYTVVTSQDLANYGLYTIETAIKVKNNIAQMYNTDQIRNALFYTIGPGVTYLTGEVVLNPSDEIIAEAKKDTNTCEASGFSEGGVGVPKDYADTISSKYADLTYVDYADMSITGNLSTAELDQAFNKIMESLAVVTRPIVTITSTTDISTMDALKNGAALAFSDILGENMVLKEAPVICYNETLYRCSTQSDPITDKDGNIIVSYQYTQTVTETSTGKNYSLSALSVELITDKNGNQEIKWNIPAELVPIIQYNTKTNKYVFIDPIRLIYKIGVKDTDIDGIHYTNSTASPAHAEFIPAVGNPYYYDTVIDADGKLHSVPKNDTNKQTAKVQNNTNTRETSSEVNTIVSNNKINEINTILGNNGSITVVTPDITIDPLVVVVDYGKPITTYPLEKYSSKLHVCGISDKAPENTATCSSSVKLNNGNAKLNAINSANSLDSITYSPFKYMSSIDRVFFYVSKNSKENNNQTANKLYSTVTFIPATTVYYEDDFGGSQEDGGLYIKYTGNWLSVTDNGSKTSGITANTDINDQQDRGEVGEGHTPYGYDSSYDTHAQFSNGKAAVVEGTISKGADGKPQFNAYAEFTFTGTGFDIISRTDMDCGMVTALITKEGSTDSVPVINKGIDELYQIPVISYTGIPYGTYTVRLNVSAPSSLLGLGSTFYLDAIRIYEPMGTNSSENNEYEEAKAAYNTDKEDNAYIASLRDYIIQACDLGTGETNGAVYVDTLNNDYNEHGYIGNIKKKEFTDEEKRQHTINPEDLQTFELIGPNEEVYLKPGYGVGFKIITDKLPESVQLSIKKPNPENSPINSTLSVQTYGKPSSLTTFNVLSATEMFYDISNGVKFTKENGQYTAIVILSNGLSSGSGDDMASITNLKLTFDEKAVVTPPEKNNISLAKAAPRLTPIEKTAEPNVALMASEEIYKQVFDTVYVQQKAVNPNYNIENLSCDEETVNDGEYVTLRFNTSHFVNQVQITDEKNNILEISEENVYTDIDKQYSDDYLNCKTWTVTARVLSGEGCHILTVKALDDEGDVATVEINVTPEIATKLVILQMPKKLSYSCGDKLDFTDMKVNVFYSNDNVDIIGYDDLTFNKTTADQCGTSTIVASYNGISTEFNINVYNNIKSVQVSKLPEKTSYKQGDFISIKGLELTVTYSNDTQETIIDGFKLKTKEANKEGTQTVIVEYEGMQTSYNVNVKLSGSQKLVQTIKNFFNKLFHR